MKTLADEIYLSEALEALSRCASEKDLMAFDDAYTNNAAYVHLPTDMIEQLESEYRKRIQIILGGLA